MAQVFGNDKIPAVLATALVFPGLGREKTEHESFNTPGFLPGLYA